MSRATRSVSASSLSAAAHQRRPARRRTVRRWRPGGRGRVRWRRRPRRRSSVRRSRSTSPVAGLYVVIAMQVSVRSSSDGVRTRSTYEVVGDRRRGGPTWVITPRRALQQGRPRASAEMAGAVGGGDGRSGRPVGPAQLRGVGRVLRGARRSPVHAGRRPGRPAALARRSGRPCWPAGRAGRRVSLLTAAAPPRRGRRRGRVVDHRPAPRGCCRWRRTTAAGR